MSKLLSCSTRNFWIESWQLKVYVTEFSSFGKAYFNQFNEVIYWIFRKDRSVFCHIFHEETLKIFILQRQRRPLRLYKLQCANSYANSNAGNWSERIRDFINTHSLVHKHVKISVNEWILETTHPHKHVTIFGIYHVLLRALSTQIQLLHYFISVDKWISEVTRPLSE